MEGSTGTSKRQWCTEIFDEDQVTDEEREIITFPRSSFILGRSGTGKTTILTMKLCQKLQLFRQASQDSEDNASPVLHQLFVTESPKLCHAVKKNVAQMESIVTNVDEISEFKDIPDTFVGIQQEKYPLILTFHKFLMMLDGSLGKSYFERFPDLRDSSHYEGRRSVALQTFLRTKEVTYDRFSSVYWRHFNVKLTKSLDPSQVFTEIISHIKGGSQEGEGCYKRSRQDYISLAESRISTLCAKQRHAIYKIFEDYEKMKLERGEFDLADFVNDIHLRLHEEDLPGDKMDYMYIDEVQDLTMRQISLFRYICYNVDEGFTFSGDTAQTIARGIDFRFEDIRSLFYNEFLMRSRNSDYTGKNEKGLVSRMFNLTQNFRTHTGVLRLAQSVINLICYYFPHSIDVLAPETSHTYGESPLVLESESDENLIISLFGHSGKWVGFGADQVILVRDDTARQEVYSYIGHQALILTVVECKGLEFQDVLLYNFFGSSPLSNQWRVVYGFLNDKNLDGDSVKSFPSFSPSRHNILCSELKQLYVAITRTRQRLWICENNAEVAKPMLDYWRRLSLVQVRKIDDSLGETMQRASTPQQWKSQGMKLFWEQNYEMATMCFKKAGEEMWEKNAKASGLRADADRCRGLNSEEASIMLRKAAEIFDSIDKVDSAAECFCELGDYERAGMIYRDKHGAPELGKAGECFSLAGNYKLAAEVYASGNLFKECLSACVKGDHFDLGLEYIEKWKQQAASNTVIMANFMEIDRIAQEFLENCARECHQKKDNASMMKFVRPFCSNDSKRDFLKSLDCLEELLDLEKESGNFNEAIKIAKSLGYTLLEVDLLEITGQYADACSLTLSYVISNTLWGSGNPGWPLKSFPLKLELLNRAMLIASEVSETFHASICDQAKFLLYEQKDLSELLQFYNALKQHETPKGEILIIRKLLDAHLEVNARKYEWDHDLHLDPRSFDQRIVRNQVSSGGLVYLWNLWKEHSLEILECLDILERTDCIKLEGIVAFCFTYFGLRLPDDSGVTFHLLSPDAAWVKSVEGFTRRNRNVVALEARYFASAARKFWLQELGSVGLKVLDALQQLHRSSMVKCLPVYIQSMCLLHSFDIAKFLADSKSIDMKCQVNRKLQDIMQQCTNYSEFVFSLDARGSSENMISLRETQLSKNLLEESVLINISGRRELSSGQIGRVMVTLLGTGKLKHGFYDKISERLSKDSPWKPVIENLTKSEALSEALHKALKETYNIHRKVHGSISPHCLLYLVERLLILAPQPKEFFFTTKSSFLEYLISLPSDVNPTNSLVTDIKYSYPKDMVDFVLQMVDYYLCNRIGLEEWIKRSRILINVRTYIPMLVKRLLIILSVLFMNWGFSNARLIQMMSRDTTISLSINLTKAFQERTFDDIAFVSAVATAFKGVGDPLVIVVLGGNHDFSYADQAAFLDLRTLSRKADIMETLFPSSTEEASHDQPEPSSIAQSEKGINGKLQINWDLVEEISKGCESLINDENNRNLNSLPLLKKVPSSIAQSEKGINGKLQINWDLVEEISKGCESLINDENNRNLNSLPLLKKMDEMLKDADLIISTIKQFKEECAHRGEIGGNPLRTADDVIKTIHSLIKILGEVLTSIARSEYNIETMRGVIISFDHFKTNKSTLDDALVGLVGRQITPNAVVASEEKNEDEDRKAEDSEAAASNPSNEGVSCSRGKGKDKKRSNSKKGKGRKKK